MYNLFNSFHNNIGYPFSITPIISPDIESVICFVQNIFYNCSIHHAHYRVNTIFLLILAIYYMYNSNLFLNSL